MKHQWLAYFVGDLEGQKFVGGGFIRPGLIAGLSTGRPVGDAVELALRDGSGVAEAVHR